VFLHSILAERGGLNWREEMRRFRGFHRTIAVGGVAVGAILLSGTQRGSAAATLGLSTTTVQNAAGQQILVTINGADTNIQSSDLYVQIGDGGSANGGISTVPTITSISMSTAGMLFAGDGAFESFIANGPLIAKDSIFSSTNLSDSSATLASITLNASSLSPGSTFTIRLANVGANVGGGPFNTDLINNLSASIPLSGTGFTSAATITVAPEPASAAMLAAVGLGLVLPRCRRRSLNA
jgi:MYXO-CTERM domain-containing protein